MARSTNAGRPAFPWDKAKVHSDEFGLTKRELFAALAMQGLCASQHADGEYSVVRTAEDAVIAADALIAALGAAS